MSKKLKWGMMLALAIALVSATAATASAGQWFTHLNGNGTLVCDQGSQAPVTGPFDTKADCQASLVPSDPPPSDAGWPSLTGSFFSIDFSDGEVDTPTCSTILTSTSDPLTGGALVFDVPSDTTFANLDVSALATDSGGWTLLSGSQAQSEPYMIVRFTDDTQMFIYSVDVNPGEPGEQTYSITGNTYITREEALTQVGDKIVSAAILAVDNGDLSIQVNGVTADGCTPPPPPTDVCSNIEGNQATVPEGDMAVEGVCIPASALPPPSLTGSLGTYLCYSHFGTETLPAELEIMQAVTLWNQGGWFLPVAVPGNDPSGNNVDGFHLVCNPAATRTATGDWLGGDGSRYSTSVHALYDAEYKPDLGIYAIYTG